MVLKRIDRGGHSAWQHCRLTWEVASRELWSDASLDGSTSIQNIWDLDGERSLSARVAHRLAVAGVWQAPFGCDASGLELRNRAVDLALAVLRDLLVMRFLRNSRMGQAATAAA